MTTVDEFPLVSIIMPTYNRAGLILESIESVRQQTYTCWELIVVDDGSEDNTGDLVTCLNDNRILFHKAGRSGLGGKIKNIGLSLAKGTLIAFIDSDDLWASDKVARQVAALKQYPEAGFTMTGGYNFQEPGTAIDHFYKQRSGSICEDIFLALFRSEIAAFAQVLLFRKECLVSCGNFKEEKSFSDVDFIIKLAVHFKAVILYEPLVFRRLHGENYIHSNWEKSFYEGIAIIEEYRHNKILPPDLAAAALFRAYINFGEKCIHYRKRRQAIGNFLSAWSQQPLSIAPIKKIGKALLMGLH